MPIHLIFKSLDQWYSKPNLYHSLTTYWLNVLKWNLIRVFKYLGLLLVLGCLLFVSWIIINWLIHNISSTSHLNDISLFSIKREKLERLIFRIPGGDGGDGVTTSVDLNSASFSGCVIQFKMLTNLLTAKFKIQIFINFIYHPQPFRKHCEWIHQRFQLQ